MSQFNSQNAVPIPTIQPLPVEFMDGSSRSYREVNDTYRPAPHLPTATMIPSAKDRGTGDVHGRGLNMAFTDINAHQPITIVDMLNPANTVVIDPAKVKNGSYAGAVITANASVSPIQVAQTITPTRESNAALQGMQPVPAPVIEGLNMLNSEPDTPSQIVKFVASPVSPSFAYHRIVIDTLRQNLMLVFDTRYKHTQPPTIEATDVEHPLTLQLVKPGIILKCAYYSQCFHLDNYELTILPIIEHNIPETNIN